MHHDPDATTLARFAAAQGMRVRIATPTLTWPDDAVAAKMDDDPDNPFSPTIYFND
ncbi:hypothetical protein C8J57DRAFT_1510219 [Mycena rebaudengoi]|nr:hypothetical protein C8J57DRAFT_1510219 [Mycena rebaudengoi]